MEFVVFAETNSACVVDKVGGVCYVQGRSRSFLRDLEIPSFSCVEPASCQLSVPNDSLIGDTLIDDVHILCVYTESLLSGNRKSSVGLPAYSGSPVVGLNSHDEGVKSLVEGVESHNEGSYISYLKSRDLPLGIHLYIHGKRLGTSYPIPSTDTSTDGYRLHILSFAGLCGCRHR